MIKPDKVSCDMLTIWRNDGSSLTVPKIHTSAWTAADGGTAQFLINYGETELAANITLTADCTVYGKDMLLKKGENSIVVPPLSAVMIEKYRY